MLWVGGGAVQSDAADEVCSVGCTAGGAGRGELGRTGCRPAGNPWLIDVPPHEPEVTELIAQADLMIAIGTAFDGPSTMNWKLPVPGR